MHFSVKNLIDLRENVNKKLKELNINNYTPNIVAVSKTFPMEIIKPLLDYGHKDFGENKVQEAIDKWTNVKIKYPNINLHMIGKLQTNKVKLAVKIFDFIHSVDSFKLAKKISDEQNKISKKIKILLQINVGKEMQKSGIDIENVSKLYDECKEINLNVVGLMCIPPIGKPVEKYFSAVCEKKNQLKLDYLSLGMSSDYNEAIKFKSNYLRIGSKIFGKRS